MPENIEESISSIQDTELASLRSILKGFNQQSLGMSAIALRCIELEGALDEKEVAESLNIYKEFINNNMSGKNLTTCLVAAYYILAELAIQVNDHLESTSPTQFGPVTTSSPIGYA